MMSPYDGVSQQVPRVRPEAFLNPRGFPCISPALSHIRRIIAGILRPFAYRRWAFAYLYDPTSAMVRRPYSGTNHHGRKAHTIMTLTKKQIKQLKAMAHHLNPIIQVGKNDLSDAAVKQADETIEKRELIKCDVLDGSGLTAKEAGEELAERLGAELVQVIGNRFVIYRASHRDDIERIRLVRG